MNELINRLIDTDFAELEGLQITGTVPVKQELLNEVLTELLRNGIPDIGATLAAPSASSSTSGAAKPRLNVNRLLKLVQRAEVKAHEGEIRLEFEIRR